MRSVLRFLLCITALSAALPLWANFTLGNFTYFTTTGSNEVEIYCHDTDNGTVTIPATVTYEGTKYSVTGIRHNAFAEVSAEVTSITLPSGIKKIGSQAFYNCGKLTYVNLPESLQEIGAEVFFLCQSLSEIKLPGSLQKIGNRVFTGTPIKRISIPAATVSIGDGVFMGCTALEAITVDSNNPNYKSIDGTLYNKACDTLISYPNGKAGDFTAPNSVTSIAQLAFAYSHKIAKVTLPSAVTKIAQATFSYSSASEVVAPGVKTIELNAFLNCSSLNSFESLTNVEEIGELAFSGCKSLKSINLANIKTIGVNAFYGCESLQKITLPASLTELSSNPFGGCTSLSAVDVDSANPNYCSADGIVYDKSFKTLFVFPAGHDLNYKLPETVNRFDDFAFRGIKNLKTYTIPNTITELGIFVFADCENLTSLTLPTGLYSLPANFIDGCTSLKSLTLPEGVFTSGGNAFSGASLNELIIMGNDVDRWLFSGLETTTVVYVRPALISTVKSYYSGPVFSLEDPLAITDLKNLICGFSFKIEKSPAYTGEDASLRGVWVSAINDYVSPDANGVYSVKDFNFGQSVTIKAFYNDSNGNDKGVVERSFTRYSKPILFLTKVSTQTSVTIENIAAPVDESVTSLVKGIVVNGVNTIFEDKPIILKDLKPGYEGKITVYAIYNGNRIEESCNISTQSLGLTIKEIYGPTAINLAGYYTQGDAEVVREWFTGKADGNTVSDHGLKPATSYTYTYNVQTDKGYTYSKDIKITTPELELTTLQPRCVSSTCAIVAASTNITDMEDNVGFQWKKYDAPASLAPSEGLAVVYGGMLEGYIKNLQPTSFYNTRAFYKDNAGEYYYGDWITFDPSDFSFFEPTVHTYPVQTVTETRATLRGYALAGTDAIISQGFQYWIASEPTAARSRVQSGSMINTVTAFGQVMEVTLDNLREGTEYRYRAYVETAEGMKYGEEQSFTTEGVAGVGNLDAEIQAPEVTVVRYYDLSGRSYSEPQKGFNIVLYSDGSTKKVVFK